MATIREERRLPLGRRRLEDRLEVFGKSHVEHLVGLVQRHDLHVLELQRPPVDVIQRSSRRGDDDVGSTLQGANLQIHRRAAVDGHDAHARAFRILVDRLGDLHRELAGRNEDETLGGVGVFAVFGDALEHRQRKCRRLAGARRCLSKHVSAAQENRDRFALDGRRLLVAEGGDGCDEGGRQAQAFEGGGRGGARWRGHSRAHRSLRAPSRRTLRFDCATTSWSSSLAGIAHAREKGFKK
jgi:hypothetical protein